jgi:hypothetical protein
MALVYGRYRSCCDAIAYEYDASWTASSIGVLWSASVVADGRIQLCPNGIMFGADGLSAEALVPSAIEKAIEQHERESMASASPATLVGGSPSGTNALIRSSERE